MNQLDEGEFTPLTFSTTVFLAREQIRNQIRTARTQNT